MIFKPMTEPSEFKWFKERTSVLYCEDAQGIVVTNDEGVVQAMAILDSFSVDACSVHFAIDNPLVLRRGFLEEIARYAYIDRGRNRLFGLVPSNNEKALKLDKHIGFTEVARIPKALSEDVDYVVLCLERKDCRWLPEELREVA